MPKDVKTANYLQDDSLLQDSLHRMSVFWVLKSGMCMQISCLHYFICKPECVSEVTEDDWYLLLPVLSELLVSLGYVNKISSSVYLLSGYWQGKFLPLAKLVDILNGCLCLLVLSLPESHSRGWIILYSLLSLAMVSLPTYTICWFKATILRVIWLT